MQENRTKQRIRDGGIVFNTYCNLADPAAVEIIGLAGFDAATIDLEHLALSPSTVQAMVVAGERAGLTTMVRIAEQDWATAQRVLDSGAQGIQVPHVRNEREAQAAVNCVRYPPLGRRGALGASRAAGFGDVEWSEHVRSSNEQILLAVAIEDAEGLENLEAIASIDGIDLVVIGVRDMAESMGIRETDSAQLRDTVEDAAARLRSLGRARTAMAVGHPLLSYSVPEMVAMGVVYFSVVPSIEQRLLGVLRAVVAALRAEALEAAPRDAAKAR